MNHDRNILTQNRGQRSPQSQPAPDPVLRRTIKQLNYIGIFDLETIEDVYNRRLFPAPRELKAAA